MRDVDGEVVGVVEQRVDLNVVFLGGKLAVEEVKCAFPLQG